MTAAIVMGVGLSCLAAVSVWRLPPLHPAQLWSIPWAIATTLYLLRLLPYRQLGGTTVVLASAATAAFVAGTLAGERLARKVPPYAGRTVPANIQTIHFAAVSAATLTTVWLAAFLIQAASRHGLAATIVSSADVRADVGAGELALTIKYVYAALAATALCASAAGATQRRRWVVLATLCAGSTYFSTARSTVVAASLVAIIAYLLGRGRAITRAQFVAGAAALGAFAFLVFLIGGELIGKTFENNPDLQSVPSTFTRHERLSVLALPYQYASAPIAALDVQVDAASMWGSTHGCAAFVEACRILEAGGVDLDIASRVRPFTREPLSWNTYTALDIPLLDGGRALAVPIIASIGLSLGALWELARRRWFSALCMYALLGAATGTAAGSFNFTAPHILGAITIALTLQGIVALVRVRYVHRIARLFF
jgi:hypothetical protein